MRLYSRKYHRFVERQVHFGIGNSTKTACGLVLFSRYVMVSLHSDSDGALITDDLERVTCKRCLTTRDTRMRKLIEIERLIPGIFDHEPLCGEKWIWEHALDVSRPTCDGQILEANNGVRHITLSNAIKAKDRKYILRDFSRSI